MPGYLIAQLEITDAEAFEAYRAAVPAVVERFGGRYLVRGGALDVLEGDWPAPRLVVIAFDSAAQARRFYDSPEYREILPLRLRAAKGAVAIAEAV